MSSQTASPTPPPTAAAGAPAPNTQRGLGEYARAYWRGVKGGELGSIPIIIGMLLICVVFQSQNNQFLSSGNFVNLILQSAAFMTIGMGIVWVLLLGEIDLSVGYVSGVAGVVTAILLTPDGSQAPTVLALVVAILCGTAIGTFHGILFTKIGIPSFVVTLAGLLAWNGVVLLLIGSRGTVTLQDDFTIALANDFLSPAVSYLGVALAVSVYAAIQLNEIRVRKKAALDHEPPILVALRIAALAVALGLVVLVANNDRGIPRVFVLVAILLLGLTYLLKRTRFGRYVFAVGGNVEAARRAGINVDRIRIAVFAIASTMAAIGGIILASRLRSVDTNAGGGSILLYSIAAPVIGGTSLFGGRGTIKSAILGAIVIASIDNGLGLLGLGSGEKFVITGGVLLLAVTVDSFSRRKQTASGRA